VTPSLDMGTWTGADGVRRVHFSLSHAQLAATGRAAGTACRERYRDDEMTVDDVLAMRQLLSLVDHLDELAATGLGATVDLTAAGLALLHDALVTWSDAREQRGWMREDERDTHRTLAPVLHDLGDLRADAIRAALEDGTPGVLVGAA
jgi:hypothetical protein